jgi:hypothetical protein
VKAIAASSKIKSAKYLKAIGSYSEGELAETIDKLSSEQRRMLPTFTSYLHDNLKQVNTYNIEGKETRRKRLKNQYGAEIQVSCEKDNSSTGEVRIKRQCCDSGR